MSLSPRKLPKMADDARLQLHLEPQGAIEVYELTLALNSLSRQYNKFVSSQNVFTHSGDARLLISSVSNGSINIDFIPDLHTAIGVITPIVSTVEVLEKFTEQLNKVLGFFKRHDDGEAEEGKEERDISVQDCDDAINIVRPIAEHGGSQVFNVYNGPVIIKNITLSGAETRTITEGASRQKAKLQFPNAERKQRVSMVWKRIDRSSAQTQGSSQDKGIIEEIDPRAKAILFTDELSYLKKQMVDDEDNPMQKVYFVDVEVSRSGSKITAYRITGFHGTDDLEDPLLEL